MIRFTSKNQFHNYVKFIRNFGGGNKEINDLTQTGQITENNELRDEHHHHVEPRQNPNSLQPNEAKGNASPQAHVPFLINKITGGPITHTQEDFQRTALQESGADGKGRIFTPMANRFKPNFDIEFNRDGERLIYSCNTAQAQPLFRQSEVKYSVAGLLACFSALVNPFFLLHWLTTLKLQMGGIFLFIPQFNYYQSLAYRVKAMYLLHGGEFVRLEFMTWGGNLKTCWMNIDDFRRLDSKGYEVTDTNVLNEDQLLDSELQVLCKKFDDYGFTVENEIIWFSEEGTVADAELFETIIKGISIDTTDQQVSLSREKPQYWNEGKM